MPRRRSAFGRPIYPAAHEGGGVYTMAVGRSQSSAASVVPAVAARRAAKEVHYGKPNQCGRAIAVSGLTVSSSGQLSVCQRSAVRDKDETMSSSLRSRGSLRVACRLLNAARNHRRRNPIVVVVHCRAFRPGSSSRERSAPMTSAGSPLKRLEHRRLTARFVKSRSTKRSHRRPLPVAVKPLPHARRRARSDPGTARQRRRLIAAAESCATVCTPARAQWSRDQASPFLPSVPRSACASTNVGVRLRALALPRDRDRGDTIRKAERADLRRPMVPGSMMA